jgi:hypothetical protein
MKIALLALSLLVVSAVGYDRVVVLEEPYSEN